MRTMRAIVSSDEGPVPGEVPVPAPRAGEVLVRIHAAALNRADLGMLKGATHGRAGGPGATLGLEWAGEIVEVGDGVKSWQVGDRVMAGGGSAFAEYVVGLEHRMYPVPEGLSMEQAATFPVALQTEHDAIVTHGLLEPGQSVLIQGASSGVGLIAMQVAKVMGAGLVIGTSTNSKRRAQLADYGADLSIDTTDADWVSHVREATEGRGVDLLIDHVSGALTNDSMRATRIGGTVVNVGRLGGMTADFNFDQHAYRRINYVGVTFRTRSASEVERIIELTQRDLGDALADGKLKLPIHQTFPLEDASVAFEMMARNEHFGKLVLVPAS